MSSVEERRSERERERGHNGSEEKSERAIAKVAELYPSGPEKRHRLFLRLHLRRQMSLLTFTNSAPRGKVCVCVCEGVCLLEGGGLLLLVSCNSVKSSNN